MKYECELRTCLYESELLVPFIRIFDHAYGALMQYNKVGASSLASVYRDILCSEFSPSFS